MCPCPNFYFHLSRDFEDVANSRCVPTESTGRIRLIGDAEVDSNSGNIEEHGCVSERKDVFVVLVDGESYQELGYVRKSEGDTRDVGIRGKGDWCDTGLCTMKG